MDVCSRDSKWMCAPGTLNGYKIQETLFYVGLCTEIIELVSDYK